MFPATSARVPQNTSSAINRRIQQETQERIARYRHASREELDLRLEELDQECDTERTLETNASALVFTGCLLAATVDRRWVYLPLTISAFLFQHAVQGWCPPLPVLRRLGVRTEREIDEERFALKLIRGDFNRLEKNGQLRIRDLLNQVRR